MFRTQPDGMWVYFHSYQSCDLVAVEVCGTAQNLNDKRSRYIPSSHSLVLSASAEWFGEEVQIQAGRMRKRWHATNTLESEPDDDVVVPVRHLRVLYALPNDLYNTWCAEHAPTGYEYFCPHSSLSSITNQNMRTFLKRMSIASQFYVHPGEA